MIFGSQSLELLFKMDQSLLTPFKRAPFERKKNEYSMCCIQFIVNVDT